MPWSSWAATAAAPTSDKEAHSPELDFLCGEEINETPVSSDLSAADFAVAAETHHSGDALSMWGSVAAVSSQTPSEPQGPEACASVPETAFFAAWWPCYRGAGGSSGEHDMQSDLAGEGWGLSCGGLGVELGTAGS